MTDLGLWRIEAVFAVLAGACVGSFLNVVIARLPEDRSLWPRSACPTCARAIPAWENLPVVSYVLLRGRCRGCGAAIPATYPLVELLGALLGGLAWVRCVPVGAIDVAHVAAWAWLLAFLGAMVAAAQIDLRHRILPDELTIYAVPAGVLGAAALAALGYDAFPAVTWQQAALGAGAFGGFLAAVAIVTSFVLGREGLGWGDVKLMAMIGSFLGAIPGAFVVLLFGSLAGSLAGLVHLAVTRRRSYLPLGPFLAWAAVVYALYGDVIVRWAFPAMGPRVGW